MGAQSPYRAALVIALALAGCQGPPEHNREVIVQLVTAGEHTCVLFDHGKVRCWGANSIGQLGYGAVNTIGDDEVPADAGWVDLGGDAVRISAGWSHTCAVMSGGGVRCWGNALNGRLGYGNGERIGDDETPASAGDIDLGAQAIDVAAGGNHTCALLEGGGVRCWGDSSFGQLGYADTETTGDDESPAARPELDLRGEVVQLVAGDRHTCALLRGGTVRCWGDGAGGRLGYGNTYNIGDNETPGMVRTVPVGGPVASLAAGGAHTCAVLVDGGLRCWGRATEGQLGFGNTRTIGANDTPAIAGDVPIGEKVVGVSAGKDHTCAVLRGGALRCWGNGANGRLGNRGVDTLGDDERAVEVGDVDVGGPVADVAAGGTHTCALLESGAVRCWGMARLGQLGYPVFNQIGDDDFPTRVSAVDLGGAAYDVVAGADHTCALLGGGRVRCWGWGAWGRLGYGNTASVGDDEAPAVAGDVPVGGPARALSAGDHHTCALLESGAVRCWGFGNHGRLGYGGLDHIGDDETPASAGDVSLGGPVESIASGAAHTCAVMVGGNVRCWGFGNNGRLGTGATDHIGDDELPSAVPVVDLGARARMLSAGAAHTCAVTDEREVRCWGAFAGGRLGYGNREAIGDDETPASAGSVPVGAPVIAVAAGGVHTCALLDGGGVRCWGDGAQGRLGTATVQSVGEDEPASASPQVQLGAPAVRISAGSAHTCAILERGEVRCWGAGTWGRLGYGNVDDIGDDEHPAAVPPVVLGGAAVNIAVGRRHSCALLEGGAVRCWGLGREGQLGTGTQHDIGDDEAPASAGDVAVR
jgi:alpha-tubulin suppressor-like RCC1 family protein